MVGAKRRQEGKRGVRVNPETYEFEGADGYTRVRRQHLSSKMPKRQDLPGARAHIEIPGEHTEQERPTGNRDVVVTGAEAQGRTGALWCQGPVGVGLSHSSEEACEGDVC
jgi:hypothetical protein